MDDPYHRAIRSVTESSRCFFWCGVMCRGKQGVSKDFYRWGAFNNYVDKRRGKELKKCLFKSTQGGGEGQKMVKFCPRSCWMPPNEIGAGQFFGLEKEEQVRPQLSKDGFQLFSETFCVSEHRGEKFQYPSWRTIRVANRGRVPTSKSLCVWSAFLAANGHFFCLLSWLKIKF